MSSVRLKSWHYLLRQLKPECFYWVGSLFGLFIYVTNWDLKFANAIWILAPLCSPSSWQYFSWKIHGFLCFIVHSIFAFNFIRRIFNGKRNEWTFLFYKFKKKRQLCLKSELNIWKSVIEIVKIIIIRNSLPFFFQLPIRLSDDLKKNFLLVLFYPN